MVCWYVGNWKKRNGVQGWGGSIEGVWELVVIIYLCIMRYRKMGLFVRVITFGWPVAICLAPFGIYLRAGVFHNERVRRHEAIHWRQQVEMLYILFYVWYFFEWLIKLATPPRGAYRDISFEREAKRNEFRFDYLETRKRYSWFKYIT